MSPNTLQIANLDRGNEGFPSIKIFEILFLVIKEKGKIKEKEKSRQCFGILGSRFVVDF